MRRRTITAVTAALLGLAMTLSPSSADAATVRIEDGRDTAAAQELLGVRIKHDRRITVVLRFSSNYFLDGEWPYSISYDTEPRRSGPEFGFFSHFGAVYRMRDGELVDTARMPGRIRYHVDTERHLLRVSIPHRALGRHPGLIRVRVSATAKPARASAPMIVDYAPGPHRFSAPVRHGRG